MTSSGSEDAERPVSVPTEQPDPSAAPTAGVDGWVNGAGALPAGAPGAPAQWAWAQQAQQMQMVETEPLEYHRLLRGTASYRWWKPLLLLLVAGVYFGIFTVIVSVAFIPLLMANPDYLGSIASGTGEVLDTQVPVSVLLSLVSIIIMIPAVILAMLTLGMRPIGRVWSVAGRLRWGLLGRLLGVALIAVVVMNVTGIALELAMDPGSATETAPALPDDFDWVAAWTSLALVVLLVPAQATAEEVVFRGLFMQVLGSWLKNPWFAILIPSVGFALSHIYDAWGLLAVGLLGVVSAWLTWRTGGLEAAIAIHIVNNIIAFGLMSFAVGGETAQVEQTGGLGSLIGSLIGYAVFIWLVLRVFQKHGYGRTRIDFVQVQMPVQLSAQSPTHG
ncbi:CPBP family intramembrane glutamic endopeptidase [Leucobacter sp. USHLN153]|uniref:CPBP family intramembrane glutamic endopeptidase n=1 Tax=Leucobacter sp. USHLN153 TaxID=3081268 RepID=UPI003019AD7D